MNWYQDKEALREAVEEHGSLRAAAVARGVHHSTVQNWWRRLGLPQLDRGVPAIPRRVERPAEREDPVWLVEALKKLGDSATVEEIADHADMSPRRVRAALEAAGHAGYRVEAKDDRIVVHRVPVPSNLEHEVLFDGEDYRFAVVSDVHLGSKHCRLEELHMAYKMIADEGITTVYNPGDIVCGRGIFPTQDYEIDLHTFEDQVAYAVENYPYQEGVTTQIITGNHDAEGVFARAGANACLAVCNQREDLVYGGDYSATYTLPQGTRILMRHPKGGKGYAKSYKVQKFAESLEGGSKPNVCLIGHYHDAGYWVERNIQLLLCGTFEGGGTLGIRVPLGAPAVGFWIVDMKVADDGTVVRFRPEWMPFYAGRRVAA